MKGIKDLRLKILDFGKKKVGQVVNSPEADELPDKALNNKVRIVLSGNSLCS